MCNGRTGRAGLLLLLLFAGVAWSAPGKFVIADVLVNGVSQRPAMISVTPDGAILGRRDDVTSWNLDIRNAPAEMLQSIDHIRLTALPGIRARFDGATLTIEAAESAFQGTHIDLQKTSSPQLDGGKGAYLNYDLSTFAGRGQRPASAAAWEVVAYADTLSLASNGVFSDTAMGRQLVRYESSLRRDFPDRLRSLVAATTAGPAASAPASCWTTGSRLVPSSSKSSRLSTSVLWGRWRLPS